MADRHRPSTTGSPRAFDAESLQRLFGTSDDLLPLWIAEPYLPLAPAVVEAIQHRAGDGWYGYEIRPDEGIDAFWGWMKRRHGWDGSALATMVSPRVGNGMAVLLELMTSEGDRVILQPPVFTDFKPLIRRANREPVRNSLLLSDGRYTMDLDDLEAQASKPNTTAMILCNPHNPVGRVWTPEELRSVAEICATHDVFVIADEIHADLALPPNVFTPFAIAAAGTGVRWAATHGPIKTFAIAGVADTLVLTDDDDVATRFQAMSSRFQLTRNNVFSLAAARAGYESGDEWVDQLLDLMATNFAAIDEGLPSEVKLIQPEATYLAWLDFRALGLDVPELSKWLAEKARLALSPGHWFGREGAGFARMTIGVETPIIKEAVDRIRQAV